MGSNRLFALRKGQEVLQGLKELCESERVTTGMFTGIGGLSEFEIGYFDHALHEYVKLRRRKQVEVISLVGNVTLLQGEPFPHVHVSLSDRRMQVMGGHLLRGIVNPFLEVFFVSSEETRTKRYDESLRLYVMHAPC